MATKRQQACPACDRTAPAAATPGVWPEFRLATIPGVEETTEIAARMRQLLLGAADAMRPLRDIRELCRLGRFRMRERRLGGARGGLEAVLAPAEGDHFEIHVDPEPRGGWDRVPAPARATLQRQRLRFRVAHEIAHSFFYERDGSVPRRRLAPSAQQEEFCDRFAAELLLPGAVVASAERSAPGLVDLATRYDVSLQMAARSFAGQWPSAIVALFVQRPGVLERQWSAGDGHLPAGWWRNGPPRGLSSWESFEVEALARAWGLDGTQALALPDRQQVVVVREGV